jgi:probable phosphoglycerate mutase
MRLFLVRHAPTAETGGVLTGRLPGVALSAEGTTAARERAGELGSLRVAALYSSPVQRCAETAEILGTAWKRQPIVVEGLAEADYGRWSGRRLSALRRLRAWGSLMSTPSRFRFPEGETLAEVQSRAVAAVETLASRHRATSVAAVTHADVIRVLLTHYLGMPLDLVHRLTVAPLSVSVVELPADGGSPRVPVVNSLGDPGGGG